MYGGFGGQMGAPKFPKFSDVWSNPPDTASDKNFNQQKYKSIGHVIEQ